MFLGGASLIASGIVITAAHKVNGLQPKQIKVRCGDWNVKNPDEYKKHQDRRVDTISVHPRYSGKEFWKLFWLSQIQVHTVMNFWLQTHAEWALHNGNGRNFCPG